MKELTIYVWIILCIFWIGCTKETDSIQSADFIGKWERIHEHWKLDFHDIDSLVFVDTSYIEFLDSAKCILTLTSVEYELDWYFRDNPDQILLTEVGEQWPTEFLYDIVEINPNSQIWERGGQGTWYYELHKYFLTKIE